MSSSDDLPESEVDFGSNPQLGSNSWMCRPCERYKYQFKDCKSLRARVHQYFIFGQSLDCSHWREDYENCLKFRKTQDPEHLQKVIESELKQREERLRIAQNNDIWKYRSEPPKDWTKPLPEWFSNQNQYSFLSRKQTERTK